jgi:hypothetical protein
MSNLQDKLKPITKHYENLNFFDNHTTNLVCFAIITILILLGITYCYVSMYKKQIQDNWPQRRCNPLIMPFAGMINAPDGESSGQYTQDNFNYCTQAVITDTMQVATMPLQFITSMLNTLVSVINETINVIREMINKVRNAILSVSKNVMGRLGNMMIPLQFIIIKMKNLLGQVGGIMTASLYTALGSYYTLQSLMGAIAEFIIDILIALGITVAVLWIVPFTWGAAAAMTVIFIAIAIPMAIILYFMIDVLKVQTDLSIPSVKCFDENTLLDMNNCTTKYMKDIKVGDVLQDSSAVTGIIQLSACDTTMYNVNNVIVSNNHCIKHNNKWIHCENHPSAIHIENYDKPYIYCLNTTSKIIPINKMTFTDWDEIYSDDIYKGQIKNSFDIHKYLDGGFSPNMKVKTKNGYKFIEEVKVNDILYDNVKVYGIVQIDGRYLSKFGNYFYNHNCISCGGSLKMFFNEEIKDFSTFCTGIVKTNRIPIYYHLLTNKGYFYVENLRFGDYNTLVDFFDK